MLSHEVLGGKVQPYRRGDGQIWQCSASVGGKQRPSTTKESSLELSKQVGEDWFLTLRGQDRAVLLKTEKSFAEAVSQFLKEHGVITEGQQSENGCTATVFACDSISCHSLVSMDAPK